MMAEGYQWRLQRDDEVRLRALPAENLYVFANPGAKATVRDRTIDEYEFPLVKVIWDREDFRTGNQPDGWYYEEHFDKAKGTEMDDETRQALGAMGAALQQLAGKVDPAAGIQPATPDAPETETNLDVQFLQSLESAVEIARESDAFAVVTIDVSPAPGNPELKLFEPTLIIGHHEGPGLTLLGAQLTRYGALIHGELASEKANDILREEREGQAG